MEKQLIVRFLNAKNRGVYTLIVEMYAKSIAILTVKMAKEMIQEDLGKASNSSVEIHYSSLAKAMARFKKRNPAKHLAEKPKEWDFKDSYEIKTKELPPGSFTLGSRKS